MQGVTVLGAESEVPPAPFVPQTGDRVWAVYWRPVPAVVLGAPAGGVWEVATGRVISAGKNVCYALDNPHLPGWYGGDPGDEVQQGVPYRFIDPSRVFPDGETASAFAKAAPAPK